MQERLQRVPFTRPVYLSIPGAAPGEPEEPRKLVAGNLSRGGMFIRGAAELEPGSRVALALEAQGQVLPFAEAEVIWTCDGTTTGPDGDSTPGSGLRFTRFLHPRSTELLGYLVSRRTAAGAPKVISAQAEPLATSAVPVDVEPPPTLAEGTLAEGTQDGARRDAAPPMARALALEPTDQPTAIAAAPADATRGPEPVVEGSLPPDEARAVATVRPLLLTQPVSSPATMHADDAPAMVRAPASSIPTNVVPNAVPPSDFMHRPLADLHPGADESPNPPWVTQMDVVGEGASSSAMDSHELRSEWFEQGEQAPTSGLHRTDEARRLGTSLALLAVLVLVAGGLIWVLRQQGTVESADVEAPVGVTSPTADAIPPKSALVAAAPTSAPAAAPPAVVTTPTVANAPAPLPSPARPLESGAPAASATAPAAALVPSGTDEPAAPAEPKQVVRADASSKTAEPATQKSSRAERHVFRSGAVQAVAVSSSGKEIFAALDLPAGASIERVFVLRSPARVVVDVRGASPRRSAKISTGGSMIQALRVGARSGGTRLVIDMKRPVERATANGRTVEVVLR